MRRVTAACGSMEAKFPTKMEKKDFDQQMDNINRGYQITLSFVDESGATVHVNPTQAAVVRFWNERRREHGGLRDGEARGALGGI